MSKSDNLQNTQFRETWSDIQERHDDYLRESVVSDEKKSVIESRRDDISEAYKKRHDDFYEFYNLKGRVLDLGCGPFPHIYRERLSDVDLVGVDPKETYMTPGSDPADFVQCIGEKIPFEGSSFETVICQASLDHVFNPGDVISEVHRVLESNGRFYLWSGIHTKNRRLIVRALKKLATDPTDFPITKTADIVKKRIGFETLANNDDHPAGHQHDFTKEGLKDLLKQEFVVERFIDRGDDRVMIELRPR